MKKFCSSCKFWAGDDLDYAKECEKVKNFILAPHTPYVLTVANFGCIFHKPKPRKFGSLSRRKAKLL